LGDSIDIDVVVPSLNCASKLRRCLTRVRAQRYSGSINLYVVDGGSTDGTVEVAREFGATVFVNPGQYSAGLEGARHFGESKGSAPYVWNLDADNFLVEETCAEDLARPLVGSAQISFTFPDIALDPQDSPFNNYLTLDEQLHLEEVRTHSRSVGAFFVTDDCPYGLTNATLIRRTILEKMGGYDSDVLLLGRLRAHGLARAAFVPSAHFTHSQTTGPADYRRKWLRRARFYASMSPAERERYFSSLNALTPQESPVWSQGRRMFTTGPSFALRGFARTGDATWLNGLVLTTVVASIALLHPVLTRRAFETFHKGSRG
jgi:glycosyltransferase involved in cell wall biosynthesis